MTDNFEHLDSELIIIEIEKCPCLYDTKALDYKDRAVKVEAWKRVFRGVVGDSWGTLSKEQQSTLGKEIQKRWKNMRDSYKRSVAEIKKTNKSGSATSTKKPYVYHKQMEFLKDAMELRPTEGTMNDDSLALELENTEADGGVAVEPETPRPMAAPTARKRKLQDPFEKDLINVLSKNLQPPEQNHDSMFLQSLIPYMTVLTNDDKLDFQIKTLQLIRSYNRPTPVESTRPTSSASQNSSRAPSSKSLQGSSSVSPSLFSNTRYDFGTFDPMHSEDNSSVLSFSDY